MVPLDPANPDSKLVRKFGLMLATGSEYQQPMVELPFTVTGIQHDGTAALVADDTAVRVYVDNHLKRGDRIRLVNPDDSSGQPPRHVDLVVGAQGGGGGAPKPVPLRRGKKYHFFICHHQGSGGDQANMLCQDLKSWGFKVWYDNDQPADQRNLKGMRKGVEDSECLLIFLSGRKETDGQADPAGDYEGPFTRWFCHEEMHAARRHGLSIIGVMETDDRCGKPDFRLEKSRALTGKSGLPMNVHAADNVHLLDVDNVRHIPLRRQQHEMQGMLDEIVRQRLGAEASAKQLDATQAPAVPLPPGKETHFFLCHHEGSGGNQARSLCDALRLGGFKVWHDNDQTADQRNFDRVRRGVEGSECLLVFLSGRKETGRQPDPDGMYESPFTLPLCHEAMHTAHFHSLTVVGVMESEKQKGTPDFALEEERALSSKHAHAATNVHLLRDVVFIPFRREPHEWRAMLAEIARQWGANPQMKIDKALAALNLNTAAHPSAKNQDSRDKVYRELTAMGKLFVPTMRCRLFFTGEGRNGKTSTRKALTGQEFDPNEISTRGTEQKGIELLKVKRTEARDWRLLKNTARSMQYKRAVASLIAGVLAGTNSIETLRATGIDRTLLGKIEKKVQETKRAAAVATAAAAAPAAHAASPDVDKEVQEFQEDAKSMHPRAKPATPRANVLVHKRTAVVARNPVEHEMLDPEIDKIVKEYLDDPDATHTLNMQMWDFGGELNNSWCRRLFPNGDIKIGRIYERSTHPFTPLPTHSQAKGYS